MTQKITGILLEEGYWEEFYELVWEWKIARLYEDNGGVSFRVRQNDFQILNAPYL